MIYWFFGYPGVGKDYNAKMLSKVAKISYINADNFLTQKEKIKLVSGTFTKDDRLVKLKRIAKYLEKQKSDTAIGDTLPDNQSRQFLVKYFKDSIIFIWVKSSSKKHGEQIKKRKNHFFKEQMIHAYIKNNWEKVENLPYIVLRNESSYKSKLQKRLIKIYRKI